MTERALFVPALSVTLWAEPVRADGPPVPELDRLSPRAVPAKRATFASGRRAARRALAARWGALPEGVRVDADERGRPVVWVDGRESATQVSITHAGGVALAAAAEAPLGVDLVELDDVSDAMAEDAFAPGELAGWARAVGDPRLAACLAFAAKEAALKWLGIGMAVPLASVRVSLEGPLGEAPWSARAWVEHAAGRASLPLCAWPVAGELFAVLLGG